MIAGDNTNSYTDTIKAMIKEQGIIDRVIFTGEVSGETKWALYKNAVLFILPSYSENFGMSVVEAMACGCPVLISDKVGLYQDIKEYDAGIVCKTDVADIKDNVINLLNDSQLRFKISKNAVTLVKNKYDIDKVTDQFIIQYNKLLKLHE